MLMGDTIGPRGIAYERTALEVGWHELGHQRPKGHQASADHSGVGLNDGPDHYVDATPYVIISRVTKEEERRFIHDASKDWTE